MFKEEERVKTTKAQRHKETLSETVMAFVKLSVFVPSWQIGKLNKSDFRGKLEIPQRLNVTKRH